MSNTDFMQTALPAGQGPAQSPQPGPVQGTMQAADMPQDAGGQPPPDIGGQGGPPPMAGPGALGLPLEQPWPQQFPVGRERYIRMAGNRHHTLWGRPDFITMGAMRYPGVSPGPWMPQATDVNQLVWGAVRSLLQNGSLPVQQLAGVMGNARGGYSKAFMEGRHAALQMQHEEYVNAQEQLIERQTKELQEYSQAYAAFGEDPDRLTQEITELAHKYNDPKLLDVLNNQGLGAAERVLAERDSQNEEMRKVASQRDKHEESVNKIAADKEKIRAQRLLDKEAEGFGLKLDDTGADTTDTEDTSDTSDASTSPSGGATAAKAPAATPGPGDTKTPSTPSGGAPRAAPRAPAGDQTFPATPQGDNPPTEGDAQPLALPGKKERTPLDMASDDLIRVGPDRANMIKDPRLKLAVLKDSLRKENAIDNVLSDPNIKTEAQMKAALAKISPSYAEDFDGFLHYRGGPSTAGLGGGSRQTEYWSTLRNLARKVNPNWSQSTFKGVQDFEDDARKPTSVQQRVQTTSQAGEQILRDLDAIQKKYGKSADTSLANLKGKFALDKSGLYAALYSDWLNYQQDIQVLTTGSPSVTEVKLGEEQVPWYGNAASYRNVVKHHMGVADARIQGLKSLWNSYQTGRPMPGLDPTAEKRISDIKRMDPVHGLMPGQTLKTDAGTATYTGIDPEDPEADVNWDFGASKRRPP